MKRAACLLCLLLAVAGASAQSADQQFRDLIQQWLRAEASGNRAALDALIADDFIGTTPTGNVVGKEDIMPPADHPPSGQNPWTRTKLGATSIRQFGTTAVVMGTLEVAPAIAGQSEQQGPPAEVRFTHVYVRRAKGWQLAAAHLARVPAE